MANMIDQKPSFHGEAKVWEKMNEYLPNDVIAYNNREINGREFDYCLFLEGKGALIIEVKGWLADKINVQGIDNIVVEGYDQPQRSPKKQARAYRFALLNKIKEKYNVSPLVFDMVCYPFITKDEYEAAHLNIVSEEQFTIFKEDLDSKEALIKKINQGYDAVKNIPHADFSHDLMVKLRQDWEPDFVNAVLPDEIKGMPYSILSVHPFSLTETVKKNIVLEYFSGTKRIVFLANKSDYDSLLDEFNKEFMKHNVQPKSNTLVVGYKNGLKIGEKSSRTFNLEIYHVDNLSSITLNELSVEEGIMSDVDATVIDKLSKITNFNMQQFEVEHSPADCNTLVEAGAGTGKTFSMVSRIAYLCNKKFGSVANIGEEIAMVTFTNDAANNMKVRLKQMFVNYFILTGKPKYLKFVEDTDRAHISTIHSFTLDILRNEVLYTGLGTNFRISANEYLRGKIYDEYLSAFLAEMELQNPNFINEIPVPIYDLKKKIIAIADRLLAKSINLKSIKPSEMGVTIDNTLPYFNDIITNVIIPAEEKYFEDVHLSNDIDLKECIILLEKVMKQIPGNIESLRMNYLFVDEFQDTDDVQIRAFQNLQKVINAECKLFVVGDLKQSIYRFRGAKLSAFKQLMNKSMYSWNTYHLNINYRTDGRLLDLYDDIFSGMGAQNYLPYKQINDRLTSNVLTDIEEDQLLVSIPCHGKDEEKFMDTFVDIVKQQMSVLSSIIKKRSDEGKEPLSKEERTIAILVRSNWQIDRLVAAAKDRDIKINTKSGGDLFQLESTLDLYRLVLLLNNPSNPVYLVNFIESNYVALHLDYQKYHGMSDKESLDDLNRIMDEFFTIRMGKTWQQIVNEAFTQPVLFVLKKLYDCLQPWKHYSRSLSEQKYYMANYEYLMERIIRYSRIDSLTLNQILEYLRINILTGRKQLSRDVEANDQGIQLMCTTIHKSKGLEYGTIILPYTYEDISDIKKVKIDANYSDSKLSYTVVFENKVRERNSNYDETVEIDEQISEESRILYVALTRAIRNCVWMNNIDITPSISWGSLMEG